MLRILRTSGVRSAASSRGLGEKPRYSRLTHGLGILSLGFLMDAIAERLRKGERRANGTYKGELEVDRTSLRVDGWPVGLRSVRARMERPPEHLEGHRETRRPVAEGLPKQRDGRRGTPASRGRRLGICQPALRVERSKDPVRTLSEGRPFAEAHPTPLLDERGSQPQLVQSRRISSVRGAPTKCVPNSSAASSDKDILTRGVPSVRSVGSASVAENGNRRELRMGRGAFCVSAWPPDLTAKVLMPDSPYARHGVCAFTPGACELCQERRR